MKGFDYFTLFNKVSYLLFSYLFYYGWTNTAMDVGFWEAVAYPN